MSRPSVLMIHTGGTLGMQLPEGTRLELGEEEHLARLTDRVPELSEMADIDLIAPWNHDSSDIGPDHWRALAELIVTQGGLGRPGGYSGVVVIHGTDTLAYTASMMAYMLRHLDRPVVFTGSQRPSTPGALMRANLAAAVGAPRAAAGGVHRLWRLIYAAAPPRSMRAATTPCGAQLWNHRSDRYRAEPDPAARPRSRRRVCAQRSARCTRARAHLVPRRGHGDGRKKHQDVRRGRGPARRVDSWLWCRQCADRWLIGPAPAPRRRVGKQPRIGDLEPVLSGHTDLSMYPGGRALVDAGHPSTRHD